MGLVWIVWAPKATSQKDEASWANMTWALQSGVGLNKWVKGLIGWLPKFTMPKYEHVKKFSNYLVGIKKLAHLIKFSTIW